MSEKQLLILEKSSVSLQNPINSNGYLVFEGTFGEIGVRNKNHRIYEESEYLPQIEALQEKIKANKLLGELNHPPKFEIDLNNVSHVIEKLEYNKSKKIVEGRCRILHTPKGQIVEALHADGIPLHISSRAAGTVKPDGKVVIKRLFTYDIVADPGFANAQLNAVTVNENFKDLGVQLVNEQYGFENDGNLLIYDITDLTENQKNDIYNNFENNIYNKKQENIMDTSTLKDIEILKEGMKKLYSKFNNKLYENENTEAKLDSVIEYLNTLTFNLNKTINHNNHIIDGFKLLENYVQYIGNELNTLANYTENIGEHLNYNINYTENIGQHLNNSINYNNALGKTVNANINHNNYIVEKVNNLLNQTKKLEEGLIKNRMYTQYVAEEADKGLQYTEKVAYMADQGLQHGDYIAEKTNYLINHVNTLVTEVNNVVNYSKHIAESSNNNFKAIKDGTLYTEEDNNINTNNILDESYEKNINSKLNILVESAQKQKALTDNPDLHFLRFLNVNSKNRFLALNESTKMKVIEEFKNKKYFNENEAEEIFENIFNPKKVELNFLTSMKPIYKEAWENLTESQQAVIIAQSKYHKLDTQYEIDNFWTTRDLRPIKKEFESLNENDKYLSVQNNNNDTISTEYLENIKNNIAKRFNK